MTTAAFFIAASKTNMAAPPQLSDRVTANRLEDRSVGQRRTGLGSCGRLQRSGNYGRQGFCALIQYRDTVGFLKEEVGKMYAADMLMCDRVTLSSYILICRICRFDVVGGKDEGKNKE